MPTRKIVIYEDARVRIVLDEASQRRALERLRAFFAPRGPGPASPGAVAPRPVRGLRVGAAALALQLAACATVAPPPAAAPAPDLSGAVPIRAGEQCPAGEGVWLPVPTAAAWAGDWTTCRKTAADCQAELAAKPSEAPSWTVLGIAAGVGALLGAGAVALVRR